MSKQIQTDFANNIRHGEFGNQFEHIEPRRLAIYKRLFHNNVNQFLQGTFPVAYQILKDEIWDDLVKLFFVEFRCESPYFKDLPMHFLQFLQAQPLPDNLGFLLELAHYEWIEMALDMSEEALPTEGFNQQGDFVEGIPMISPLVVPLTYQYPVHQIGVKFRPDKPSEQPFCFMVYRAANHKIHFSRTTAMTVQLIMILQQNENLSGRQCVEQLIPDDAGINKAQWLEAGLDLLQDLHQKHIILGSKI